MPTLPDGGPAPADGSLPDDALAELATRPFGVYVHVPYCRVRCGYCDFNTYAVTPGPEGEATVTAYPDLVLAELDLAVNALGDQVPEVGTVFVGGGTPTLVPSAGIVRILDGIRERWGLRADAEVTTEANPDTVTARLAQTLAAGGVTRVSLGMQSAVPHVLGTLDRTHDPAGVARAATALTEAGLQVSLDLIYGTPGESLTDWRISLEEAIALEPDHLSAYALTVEEGTKLAARVRRGEIPRPADDDEADKYELADAMLAQAGYSWYEVSNWARTPADRCRHNLGYWTGAAWWGAGPGAHSHVGGVRWWNVKHPTAYESRVRAGRSPAAAREILTPLERYEEDVLLGVRLADGMPVGRLRAAGLAAIPGLIADGLIDGQTAVRDKRIRLTQRGRLLADTVVRHLVG